MAHTTRPQNTAIPGEHLVVCAICPNQWLRSAMRFMVIQVPGFPNTNALVCPKCYDPPNPRADRPRPRPVQPPDIIQPTNFDYDVLGAPTLTSISPSTGTAAFFLLNPIITLTGTNFTARTVGRIGTDPNQSIRTTTYVSATQIRMALRSYDCVAGTHAIEAFLVPPPTPANGERSSDPLSLVIT